MNLIKELKQEHREIISLLNNLTSYMAGEISAKIDVMLNLRNLKSVLTKHVEKENKHLYPQLAKAKDKKARETAKKYSKEMLEIGKRVFAFFGQYLHLQISELETNKKFKKELKGIAVIVSRRIAAEEKVLFPLFEKCCQVKPGKPKRKEKPADFDITKIKAEIEKKIKAGEIKEKEGEFLKQREPIRKHLAKVKESEKLLPEKDKWIKTGIPGFDELMEKGIPKGTSVLIAGGAGTGKTIFCLQTLFNAAKNGEKCLYLSFEESEQRLQKHLDDFGWKWKDIEKKGLLKIVRKEPFSMTASIEAMLAKAKGELLINLNEVLEIIPPGFQPDIIAIDSITAIASAFGKKEEGYRIFIEQLFRYFEALKVTSFFISETEQIPTIYSSSGTEEFLADGVIVLYAIKQGNVRENAIEVLKLRGAKHQKKIVAMQITDKGIEVFPEQEVFGKIGE